LGCFATYATPLHNSSHHSVSAVYDRRYHAIAQTMERQNEKTENHKIPVDFTIQNPGKCINPFDKLFE
jgi:hypothetical protein